jgi:hypothetical protein
MGPILNNNPTESILGHIRQWSQGVPPTQTAPHLSNRGVALRNIAEYSSIVEMYGFLNLHRQPFYNNVASDMVPDSGDGDLYASLARIGDQTRALLQASPAEVARLAQRFTALQLPSDLPIEMEGIALVDVANERPADVGASIDRDIAAEFDRICGERVAHMTEFDRAAAMLHTMLDAHWFAETVGFSAVTVTSSESVGSTVPELPRKHTDVDAVAVSTPVGPTLGLPPCLRPIAEEALACLGAGFHVLLAGPPGTGKTTLAQLIGHAWNGPMTVRAEISLLEAPPTTVANSAWSPFHTIGGIVPDGEGGYRAHRGLFMAERQSEDGVWRLRDECVVLDEMNRADLDRCIGELYPLLSRSAHRVEPAGIPGIREVRASERFRLVATINDATIDDIVFPISEGLARRFLRFDLPGASVEDLQSYLDAAAVDRRDAAMAVVRKLFDRCEAKDLLDPAQALTIGVGYFAVLRQWARGDLVLPRPMAERDLQEQALHVMSIGLRSAARDGTLAAVLAALRSEESSA